LKLKILLGEMNPTLKTLKDYHSMSLTRDLDLIQQLIIKEEEKPVILIPRKKPKRLTMRAKITIMLEKA
jgi:hypothetical protein